MDDKAKPPVIPRPAATILLLRDDPFEVLMVKRHDKAFFASALVFPGGTVDPEDGAAEWLPLIEGAEDFDDEERALRIAALRETFEEAGVLIARDAEGQCVRAPGGSSGSFLDIVRASGGRLMLHELERFAHWITPEGAPRRFDTHFLLCRAPDGQEAVADGGETVSLEWVAPADALARAAAGERSILFPTRLNLSRLAESSDSHAAFAAAKLRPRFTVLPRMEQREDGFAVVIPQEAGYAETEDHHPRAAQAKR